ncbi:tRNA (guanine-N(1)-)-methyltransferase [Mesomycoplasma hyopneumoniae]|nr:tRNA (guanine-N(1)-)-methyltransferase [Mesomycoplasma hyopneumoniae]
MKINILTLFPRYFEVFCRESIIGKAIKQKKITINVVNFRDFSKNKHKKVDDYVYGGGPGLLLQIQPVVDALEKVGGLKIALSPQGQKFDQSVARKLAKEDEITILCGHYEGFDQRIIDNFIDFELSLGDFILTGGEIAAMAIIDAIIRLKPDIINPESLKNETFNDFLLDFPQYSRPANFRGLEVPKVLISGNHREIGEWRQEQRELITKKKRPDLWEKFLKIKNKNKLIFHYNFLKQIKNREFKMQAKLIEILESSQIRLYPQFQPGDNVRVYFKIQEGNKTRIQIFEGLVIKFKKNGLSSNFVVRKISHNVGVERTFLLHSPLVDKVEVIRSNKVRRAKLYYMKKRSGKSARLKEIKRKELKNL